MKKSTRHYAAAQAAQSQADLLYEMAQDEQNPQKRDKLLKEAIRFTESANRQYAIADTFEGES